MLPSSEQTLQKKKTKKKWILYPCPPSPPHTKKKQKQKNASKITKFQKEYLGLSLFFSSDEII